MATSIYMLTKVIDTHVKIILELLWLPFTMTL